MSDNEITMAEPAERVYPPYPQMIKQLFKLMPEAPMASLLHALVGVSGEVAEISCATSNKNIREEGGDLTFYIEAAKQQFTPVFGTGFTDSRAIKIHAGNVFSNMSTLAGDMLDLCKKAWVYGNDLKTGDLTGLILTFEINLDFLFELVGTTGDEVRHGNQVKLIGPGGRFESGFYSDAQAIARADKAPGEDRSFFGKLPDPTSMNISLLSAELAGAGVFVDASIDRVTLENKVRELRASTAAK